MTCKDTLIAKPSQILLPFATVELVEKDKPTLPDKSGLSPYAANSQRQKSSKTTEAASISNEKGFKPYWSVLCEEISSKLLLPIGTDSPDSAERLYNSWLNKTVENSWFSTKLYTVPKKSLLPIGSQYSISFPAECTVSGDTVIKSKKIEISPTTNQKTILRKWFGGSRFFYNRAVDVMKDGSSTNFKILAPQLIADAPDWHVDIPRQIKVGAVMDACQAVRNAKVKCKQTGEFQKVKFRSRKQPRQTLYLRADTLKARGFYVRLLGEMKMTEPLPALPQGQGHDPINEVKDSQLIMENGRYFLCVTYESQEMCKRGKRNLRKKSVRQMLPLSHYRFKQRLKQKALEYGVQVIDVCEAYTSKTVSWTGEVIEKLGGAKVITASDGTRMDRDLNGARGIFVKNIARALRVLPLS